MQIYQPSRYNPQYQSQTANLNFCSNKNKVKAADDICRMVMREFPVYSNTRLERFTRSDSSLLYKLYSYTDSLISEIRGFCKQAKSPLDHYLRELDSVKKYRMGNCRELADITEMAFRMNGYKNAEAYNLIAYNPVTEVARDLDHVVVGVNLTRPIPKPVNSAKEFYGLDNGAIIVDPWLGHTIPERSASAIYKHDPSFSFKVGKDEIVVYSPSNSVDVGSELTKKDMLFFRHKYAELSQKKKFSLWERLLWRFMDKSKYNVEEISPTLKATAKRNYKLQSALSAEEFYELLNGPKVKP